MQEGEETEKVTENLFHKIIAENFPSLRRDVDTEIKKALMSPVRFKSKILSGAHYS